jgi:hypothetical protein
MARKIEDYSNCNWVALKRVVHSIVVYGVAISRTLIAPLAALLDPILETSYRAADFARTRQRAADPLLVLVSIPMKLCRTQVAFTRLNSSRRQSQMDQVTQPSSALHGNCRQSF